jgi:hypothetical protein
MRLASTLTFWSNGLDVMRVLAVWKGLSIICKEAGIAAEEAAQHTDTPLAHLQRDRFCCVRQYKQCTMSCGCQRLSILRTV